MTTSTSVRRLLWSFVAAPLAAGLALATPALAQQTVSQPEPRVHANWLLANRYSNTALRNVVFGTAVQPQPVPAVTVTLPVPPPAATVWLEGVMP